MNLQRIRRYGLVNFRGYVHRAPAFTAVRQLFGWRALPRYGWRLLVERRRI